MLKNLIHFVFGYIEYVLIRIIPGKKIGGKRKVLFLRLDALGDFMIWLSPAESLSGYYRDAGYDITLAADSRWVSLASIFPFWDHIVPVDTEKFRRNLFYRLKSLYQFKRMNFTVVINPTRSRRYWIDDAIVTAAQAPVSIGISGDCSNQPSAAPIKADRYYSRLSHVDTINDHELLAGYDFSSFVTAKRVPANVIALSHYLPPKKMIPTPYFLVCPGSGSEARRRWSDKKFAAIIDLIIAKTGWQCVISGNQNEQALCERINAQSQYDNTVWCQLTLPDFVAAVAQTELLLGNESSGSHIAIACRTPSVVILGRGHFGRFQPYPADVLDDEAMHPCVYQDDPCHWCNWDCDHPAAGTANAFPCIEAIGVEQVWQKTAAVIDSITTSQPGTNR